jgi:hypothetical protein
MKVAVSGAFTITVRNADGSVKQTLEFENTIVDSGMNALAGTPGAVTPTFIQLWTRLVLSTNSTAPSTTDTVMGGSTANSTSSSSTYPNSTVTDGSPTYQFRRRAGFFFAAGTATGTWSSVGLENAFGPVLFCRTLIKVAGIPTTLTVLASESLDIQYEFRILPTLTDASGSVVINGTSYPYTSRVYGMGFTNAIDGDGSFGSPGTSFNGVLHYGPSIGLGTVTSSGPTGTPFTGVTQTLTGPSGPQPTTRTFGVYTLGSFTRNITFVWSNTVTSAALLVNGVQMMPGGCIPPTQFVFSTPIPKGVAEQLSLTFTLTWTRA